MGRKGRCCGVAPIQAGPAPDASGNLRAGRLDGGTSRERRASAARSGGAAMSVTLDHVTRTVDGVATIRDVSLTLERGTLSVLLGPTLSGKTSIMRLLAGLDRPASGRVL